MHEAVDQLLTHVRATWRYRWLAAGSAWIIALAGWTAVYLAPDRYEASARVYVNTQSVLRPLLAGLTVQPNVDQAVAMIGQTLTSRPNLEKVIEMAELGLKTSVEREQLISHLSRELTIKSAGRENLYAIAYADKNPQEAKRIVEALLTLFMQGTLGDQQKDSESARHFIDDQLKIYNEKLVAAENAMSEFRRRHMGLMAGDRRDYYTRLVEAQSALNAATLEFNEAQNSRDAIKKQLAGETEIPSLLPDKTTDAGGSNPEIDSRIQALEQKLDSLRLNYTEEHPDIVAIVRIISQLQERKRAEAKVRKSSPSSAQVQDPVHQQLAVALASAEANVAAMKARVTEYGRRYNELKATADAVPQVDAEYTQLTRDYEVTKKNYENLLSRRESAQISRDMETRAGVTDFRVVDPPEVPSVPKSPNRRLLTSLVLLVAVAGGLGVALLLSQLRPTINDAQRLKDLTGLQVLGTVAMAWTNAQRERRARGFIALLVSYAGLLSTYAVIMAALVITASRA
jgi:polysaccharide chain length determinant protein (PEP-CTERM system associated)